MYSGLCCQASSCCLYGYHAPRAETKCKRRGSIGCPTCVICCRMFFAERSREKHPENSTRYAGCTLRANRKSTCIDASEYYVLAQFSRWTRTYRKRRYLIPFQLWTFCKKQRKHTAHLVVYDVHDNVCLPSSNGDLWYLSMFRIVNGSWLYSTYMLTFVCQAPGYSSCRNNVPRALIPF